MNSGILKKKSILNKTAQVGLMTCVSRVLGLIREVLQARYLGLGPLSDAFIIAFKLPNSLRKIFAEGALSAAFIPIFVRIVQKDDRETANSLMTLTFLFLEGILLLLCIFVFFNPNFVIHIFAPGFSHEHVFFTAKYLKILISFIVFVSSSALLAVALNSVNHFLVPAAASVILNIGFITALVLGIKYSLPVDFLCYSIIFSGFLLFCAHLFTYFYYNFSFAPIKSEVFPYFRKLLAKFAPVSFCKSIVEVNLALDTAFASYLQAGSVSLMTYAYRFMHIPYGVFGVAFSTILLPHFSRIAAYSKNRFGFYLLECVKLIAWVTVPMVIFMSIFSREIFVTTIAMSGKFPMDRLGEAQALLIAFLASLSFICLNSILLNIYYSLNDTRTPMIVTLVSTVSNLLFNFVFMHLLGSVGLAIATTCSSIFQTVMLVYFLKQKYSFEIYFKQFFAFCRVFVFQVLCLLAMFLLLYTILFKSIAILPEHLQFALLNKFYFWFWVGPLIGVFYLGLYRTRRSFGVKIYFLD